MRCGVDAVAVTAACRSRTAFFDYPSQADVRPHGQGALDVKFMLMMHAPANAPAGAGVASWKPEEVHRMIKFMKDLNADLGAAGELVGAEGLDYPPRPRIVRAQGNGKPIVTDGPFVETKEVVGGFAILEAASKEDAIRMTREFIAVAGDGECELRQIFATSQPGTTPADTCVQHQELNDQFSRA